MAKENQQEIMYKLSMYEQHIKNLQQQIQAVEQAIIDMGSINLGLDDLVGKKDKEILAPIGKGIFVKAKLLSEDLIVDIGNKNFVAKDIPKTKELLKNQIEKLENIKVELNSNMEKIGEELMSIMNAGQTCECESDGECNCSDEKENCLCMENEK